MSHAERLHEILLDDLYRRMREAEAEAALRKSQIEKLEANPPKKVVDKTLDSAYAVQNSKEKPK